jgi:hypothetical protein
MAGEPKVTTDHKKIRKWVEERNGKPSSVIDTEGKNDPGLLRIDYPGRKGKTSLKEISWEDFFEKFEEKNLAMLYQDKTAGGGTSRFSKFISRDTAKNRNSINNRDRKKSTGRTRSTTKSSKSKVKK